MNKNDFIWIKSLVPLMLRPRPGAPCQRGMVRQGSAQPRGAPGRRANMAAMGSFNRRQFTGIEVAHIADGTRGFAPHFHDEFVISVNVRGWEKSS